MQNRLNVQKLLLAAAAAAVGFVSLRLVLPLVWPFLLGLAAALSAQRTVELLRKRTGMPRGAASFLCMLALFSLFGAALYILCRLVCGELVGLVRELPALASAAAGPLQALRAHLEQMAAALPDGLSTGMQAGVERLFSDGAGLGARVYDKLFSLASGFLERLPEAVLFAVTAVISGFMLCSELPTLRRSVRRVLPPVWHARVCTACTHMQAALGSWLRAECRMMGITFLIVNLGLLILGVRFPLAEAAAVTLVDALPVFGTGTVLIPWALVSFLRGSTRFGVGLLILWGVAALTRQCLEPRLVGRQAGLSPVWTLLAVYTGFRLVGVWGMVLFPLLAVLGKRLWDHSGLQKADASCIIGETERKGGIRT